MLLTRRLHYIYLPTNKTSALEKTKQEKKNPMWELALSQASFHSFVKSNVDLQMTRMESIPWCRGGGQGAGLLLLTICLSCIAPPLPVASRTCDLEAKQIIIIIIKKIPSNMQVSKFSSFRVYCRKRGKTDKLKISRLSSWFSILLLGLHLLCLVLFFLRLLFVAVALVLF